MGSGGCEPGGGGGVGDVNQKIEVIVKMQKKCRGFGGLV